MCRLSGRAETETEAFEYHDQSSDHGCFKPWVVSLFHELQSSHLHLSRSSFPR